MGGLPPAAMSLAGFTVGEGRLTLPDTAVDLVWADERVTVIGPMSRARPVRLPVGTRALLLSLDPLVAAAWLGMPLDLLTDRVMDLADIDSGAATALSRRFAEGRMGDLVGAGRPGGTLALAADALAHGVRVAKVAERVGLSERQLERSFERRMGLSPKRFARIAAPGDQGRQVGRGAGAGGR